jgi:microcystin-dependent protein
MSALRCLGLVIVLLASGFVSVHATVPPIISYQGKLMQPSGAPVPDDVYSIQFAIYDAPTGGTPLWSETNPSVQVKSGLFATMLGSVVNLPANIFDGSSRFFGVKVGGDPEMTPRQQVASVAFAVKAGSADIAATVPDGSVIGVKIAASTISGDKLSAATVTADKLAVGVAIPPGGVIMWSGAANAIPQGWALCDGTNGTPNLRNRFIVGAGDEYAVDATGGEKFHQLTAAEMPSHRNSAVNSADCGADVPGRPALLATCNGTKTGWGNEVFLPNGGDQPHENRPPYYALCFIMKLAY